MSKNKETRLSPLGAEMAAGLSAFCDALETGEPIEKKFTVRTVTLDLKPSAYGAMNVKALRSHLGASQPLLRNFSALA